MWNKQPHQTCIEEIKKTKAESGIHSRTFTPWNWIMNGFIPSLTQSGHMLWTPMCRISVMWTMILNTCRKPGRPKAPFFFWNARGREKPSQGRVLGTLGVEGIFSCHSSSSGSRGPHISSIRSLGMGLGAVLEEGSPIHNRNYHSLCLLQRS